MLPLRDHNPSGRTPWLTYLLIGFNSLIFIIMLFLPAPQLDQFIFHWALIPRQITQGQALFTLISSMFLHASLGHLIGNMLFLNIFGDNLEDYLGRGKFILFYLLTGIAGSVLQIALNPQSPIPLLGASGAIAGLMGGYLVLFPYHRIDLLVFWGFYAQEISVPAFTMLFYWFLAQLLGGVGSLGVKGGGIAYGAHLGGFLSGVILIQLYRRLRALTSAH